MWCSGFAGVSTAVWRGKKSFRMQTYSPVVLQCESADLWSVFGMRVFPAPAQNQPLILMGCRCSASQPLPLKLHLRPEVQMELTLSAKSECIQFSKTNVLAWLGTCHQNGALRNFCLSWCYANAVVKISVLKIVYDRWSDFEFWLRP